MKKTKTVKHFVIVSRETGNVLVCMNGFGNNGRCYMSYQHFCEAQEKIAENKELGTPTVFTSRRDANKFAEQIGAKNYEIAETIYGL